MITLPEVIASNERITTTFPNGLVAVFIGGTSGVGEYTLKALAKYAPQLRAYIVGRSQEAADRIIKECRELNPGSKFEFIKADVSLLKNVDDVCRQIKSRETYINILFESQGSMAFSTSMSSSFLFSVTTLSTSISPNQSIATSEGLHLSSSLVTHSRLRFILNLLPLLQRANSLRRVVSVGAATLEGPIDTTNIPGVSFPLRQRRDQIASVETLLLEKVGRRAPNVSLVHTVPGVVKSGITRDAQGFRMRAIIAISSLLGPLIQPPTAEWGERHVFVATSAMYAAPNHGDSAAVEGVPLPADLPLARGIDGKTGSGVYSIDNKCESASQRVENLLLEFRENGTADKVWDYVVADFKRITGTIEGDA